MSVIEVIFPKVRAELLRLLFADPAKEFHLRELTRRSKPSLGTIQQEVGKLSAAELLTARRDGNRLYFRANPQHPIFPELHRIALKTTGLRELIVDASTGFDDIQFSLVFGSEASNTSGAKSDVSLLVVG